MSGQNSTYQSPEMPFYGQAGQQQQQQQQQQGSPYQQQQYHQQHQPQAQQQQYYQQGQAYQQGPYGTSTTTHEGVSENDLLFRPSTQLGLQLGNQMLNVGQDYVNKNISPMIPYNMLKTYFNVTNTYVIQKLGIILFPFRHRAWQRAIIRDPAGNIVAFHPPREDINSPDLYIPVMAAVTYVLLVGMVLGLRRAFHPEQLGITATGAVIFILCELMLVKLGAYILSLGNDVFVLDMLAIIGYNFVPLIVTLLADLFAGRMGKYIAFLYTSLAMAFFMLRSLRHSFLPETSTGPLAVTQRRTRVHFLFGVVAIQILCSYFLLV